MQTLALVLSALAGAAGAAVGQAACSVTPDVAVTFYGSPDNDPAGSDGTAYACGGRGKHGRGSGTHADPLTFATAPGEYNECEVVYSPYLKKYLRMEDSCAQCTADWSNGKKHIDVWTGSLQDGGPAQIDCENALTPESNQVVIRDPAPNLPVDTTALWTGTACNTKSVYKNSDPKDYC